MSIAAIKLNAVQLPAVPYNRFRSLQRRFDLAPWGLLLLLACGAVQAGLLLILVLLATVHAVVH